MVDTQSKAKIKAKIEELVGRLDAVKSELSKTQAEQAKFLSQNLTVEAREAAADVERLRQRLNVIEAELNQLRRFW